MSKLSIRQVWQDMTEPLDVVSLVIYLLGLLVVCAAMMLISWAVGVAL